MPKLILVFVLILSQCRQDLQEQTIDLSGRQEKENGYLSNILINCKIIRGLKEDVSQERNAKNGGHILRKFLKQLLSNKFAKVNKKKNGSIEIVIKKTQPHEDTQKTIPIVVNDKSYSRFIRFS